MSNENTNVKLELGFTDAEGFVMKVDGNGADLATVLVMAFSASETFADITDTALKAYQSNKEDCVKNFQEFLNSK